MSIEFIQDTLSVTADQAETLILDDGRRLAWLQCGDPSGIPVLFLHGTPDSRFGGLLFHDLAKAAGLRIISPDRPGYGKSDFQPNRNLGDWSSDVRQLLDHLCIERVIVWGISGGGAYCCILARDLSDRIAGVLTVCGMMPPTREEHAASKLFIKLGVFFAKLPKILSFPLFRAIYSNMAKSNTEEARLKMLKVLPEESRQDALDLHLFHFMALSGESNRSAGPAGARQEMQLYAVDASTFDFGMIHTPFTIMHGEEDVNVPVSIARRVEAAIPQSKAIYFPGEAHTFWFPNRQRMIDELKQLADSAKK